MTGPTTRRVGVSLRTAFPGGDVRAVGQWLVERAAAARDAGLHSLFVGDHHVTGSPYFQNTPTLGRLLGEWRVDRPAGALFLLPLWHPVLLAEQVGTLASLASGPFIVQCALGAGRSQFDGMGVPLKERVRRFEGNLEAIRRLLAGEAVDGAAIGPLPPEPVAVWIGGSAQPAVDRAARLGDGWIAGPQVALDEAVDQLERYRQGREAHGLGPGSAVIRRDIHVGADRRDADRVAQPVVDGGYRGFPPDALVIGGPEEVAGTFATFFEAGYDEVLVRHLADDQREVLASFERLAEVQRLLSE